MPKKSESNHFEESINRLEKLVEKMESRETSLEQNLAWFEEGVLLVQKCQEELRISEKRVQKLIKSVDGFKIEDLK
ncbi:MAG: exodeoxyribonuclease VII small subunit [Candidatus Marinimicrobia bacterium]|nr:exodeoxyribonuclease VII small subunit [Candidatus Neomarinimicrobiota bacterium]|tara:strand:- start:2354 stop:2581 length:228 start_codon:yes stop_codon:yes gene_type:complete